MHSPMTNVGVLNSLPGPCHCYAAVRELVTDLQISISRVALCFGLGLSARQSKGLSAGAAGGPVIPWTLSCAIRCSGALAH